MKSFNKRRWKWSVESNFRVLLSDSREDSWPVANKNDGRGSVRSDVEAMLEDWARCESESYRSVRPVLGKLLWALSSWKSGNSSSYCSCFLCGGVEGKERDLFLMKRIVVLVKLNVRHSITLFLVFMDIWKRKSLFFYWRRRSIPRPMEGDKEDMVSGVIGDGERLVWSCPVEVKWSIVRFHHEYCLLHVCCIVAPFSDPKKKSKIKREFASKLRERTIRQCSWRKWDRISDIHVPLRKEQGARTLAED